MSKALAKGDHADANNKRRPADGAFLSRGNMLMIMSLVEDFTNEVGSKRACEVGYDRDEAGQSRHNTVAVNS